MNKSNTNRILKAFQESKPARFLLYIIGIVAVCLSAYYAIILFVYIVNSQPQYIEVNIDFPGEHDWSYTDRIVRVWSDDDKYFIWRQEANIYKHAPDNFETAESVIEYIDKQIVKNGWKRIHCKDWSECNSLLPESNFLEWESTYIAYKPQDWIDERGTPTLCLAVWEIENYDGFNVVIMTENPSLLVKMRYSISDM